MYRNFAAGGLRAPLYAVNPKHHMAIHPYPAELEGEVALRDGRPVRVRPIRPKDAEPELAFFGSLSARSRYHRFMQHLPELPPRMLARFTQLDYDRELALVALHPEKNELSPSAAMRRTLTAGPSSR